MNTQLKGRIVPGLRAASGASRIMRRGTIALQLPHFRKAIPEFDSLFDGALYLGTLNVEIPHHAVEVGAPPYRVSDVAWERGMVENFYFAPCLLRFGGKDYRGLIYIPDPATKPRGLPVGRYLEVLTSRIPFIRYGSPVRISFASDAVRIVRSRGRTPTVRRMVARPHTR